MKELIEEKNKKQPPIRFMGFAEDVPIDTMDIYNSDEKGNIEMCSSEETEYEDEIVPVVPLFDDKLKELNKNVPPAPVLDSEILSSQVPSECPPPPPRKKKPKKKKYPKVNMIYDKQGIPIAPPCKLNIPPLPHRMQRLYTMQRMTILHRRKMSMGTQLREAKSFLKKPEKILEI